MIPTQNGERRENLREKLKTMKTAVLTPNSSVKSTTTATISSTMDGDSSETRDNSCYFPGCRKDANCNCQMCLASMNATLDLMPMSIHRGSVKQFSKFESVPKTPISFKPSLMSTPKSDSGPLMVSPPLHSTARTRFKEKVKKQKIDFGFCFMLIRVFLVLSLVLGAEFGFPSVISRVLQPKLSPQLVRHLGERLLDMHDLNEKLIFLSRDLKGFVGDRVENCSSADATWEIVQDGLLMNSRCTLYKSGLEKVSIWGWPLQTAGLLTTDISPRSFTILAGRVTEWSNGEVRYLIRNASTSWEQGKWSSSVLHLDQNTWILEYKRSSLIENRRLLSAAVEFLKFRMLREVQKMKQGFWLYYAFEKEHSDFTQYTHVTPT